MARSPRLLLAAGLGLSACGGQATAVSRVSDGPGGRDASSGVDAQSRSIGGSSGTSATDSASAVPADARPMCAFPHPTCDGFGSYLLMAGVTVPLKYPSGPGCGVCTAGSCEVWADVTIRCGQADVALAVCTGPNGEPPCIDTTSKPGSFVYPNGDLYDSARLYTLEPIQDTASGVLDFDAILDATRSTGPMSVSVHVHVCGAVHTLGIPC